MEGEEGVTRNVCQCGPKASSICVVFNCRPSYCRMRWRAGLLYRWGSAWVGVHWSAADRRVCINLIPFVTIWITAPGGDVP